MKNLKVFIQDFSQEWRRYVQFKGGQPLKNGKPKKH